MLINNMMKDKQILAFENILKHVFQSFENTLAN